MLAAAEAGLVDRLLLLSYPLCASTQTTTRRNDPMSYGPGTSRASKPLRCSFMARGMGSAPSTR
jgi:hypothetical protein